MLRLGVGGKESSPEDVRQKGTLLDLLGGGREARGARSLTVIVSLL